MMPDLPALYAAIDGTWPAARRIETPRWTLRDGDGGGKRVSCATSRPGWSVAEIAAWREAAAPLIDEWKASVAAKGGDADAILDAYVKSLEANDAKY